MKSEPADDIFVEEYSSDDIFVEEYSSDDQFVEYETPKFKKSNIDSKNEHLSGDFKNKDVINSNQCLNSTTFVETGTFKDDLTAYPKENLKNHMIQENSKLKEFILLRCEECSFNTDNKHTLVEHVWQTHNSLQKKNLALLRKCKICGYESKHKNHFFDHLSIHKIFGETKISHKCEVCSYETLKRNHLKRHMLKHKKLFNCKKCSFDTAYKSEWMSHKSHCNGTNSIPSTDINYTCQDCGFSTQYKTSLQRHMISSKSYNKCTNCSFKSLRQNCLKVHKQHCHPSKKSKQHICTNCDYKVNNANHFKRHVLKHADQPLIMKCFNCDYETIHKDYLERHIKRVHQNSNLYKCSECSFQTKYKDSLKTHSLSHQETNV